jgi:hypothetical protein
MTRRDTRRPEVTQLLPGVVMIISVIRIDSLEGRHAPGTHPLAKIKERLNIVKGIPNGQQSHTLAWSG